MRFITQLSPSEVLTLQEGHAYHPSKRFRMRCLAILLSHSGRRIGEIVEFLSLKKNDTISDWFNRWEKYGITGLNDRPKSGRRPKLNINDNVHIQLIHDLLKKEKQDLDVVLAELSDKLNVTVSKKTLKRFLKSLVIDGGVLDSALEKNSVKKSVRN